MTVRVLVVSDQAESRSRLAGALEADQNLVVSAQTDVSNAEVELTRQRPGIAVLDLVELLASEAMAKVIHDITVCAPIPLVVTVPQKTHGRIRMAILRAGAVKVLNRPLDWTAYSAETVRRNLSALAVQDKTKQPSYQPISTIPVIGLAASTGGPPALELIVDRLGEIAAPILVVQHIHPGFNEGLAEILAHRAQLPVSAAKDNLDISKGGIFVAPSTHHLLVTPELRLRLSPEPGKVAKPSADVLFSSIARSVGRNGIGVVLTGMGRDGAVGLRELRDAGGRTLAQDEATSIIYGMPRAADEAGAAEQILPLDKIPAAILDALGRLA